MAVYRYVAYFTFTLLGLGSALTNAQSCGANATGCEVTDAQALLQQAQRLTNEHQFEQALSIYEQLIAREPDNVDYLFGKAQLHYWNKQPQEAYLLSKHVLQQAPNYVDAIDLHIRAALALNNSEAQLSAKQWWQQGQKLAPAHNWPDIPASAKSQTESKPTNGPDQKKQISTRLSRSWLSNNAPDWTQLDIAWQSQSRLGQTRFMLAAANRYEQHDALIQANQQLLSNSAWRGAVGLGLGTAHQFFANYTVNLTTEYVAKRWVARLDARENRYQEHAIHNLSGAFEYYWSHGLIALTEYYSWHQDDGAFVTQIAARYMPGSALDLGAFIASGEELDVASDQQTTFTKVTSLGADTRWHITGDRYLSLQLAKHNYTNTNDRLELQLGYIMGL